MVQSDEKEAWVQRSVVVGKAQARYLWLLLLTGLFYLAVHAQIISGMPGTSDRLVIPLIDLALSAVPVWASGPAVISTLILAVHGTLRAYKTAAKALSVETFGVGEEYDLAPNTLDFVAYTTSESPPWARGVLLLTYPLYLGIFCAEAWWLLLAVRSGPAFPGKWLFLSLGAVLTLFGTWRVIAYALRNSKRAYDVWRGKKGV